MSLYRTNSLTRAVSTVCEPLESRRLLCTLPVPETPLIEERPDLVGAPSLRVADPANIVWVNRGQASDGFDARFGTSAELARRVIDAVIFKYERMIGSFNYSTAGQTYSLTVRMDASGSGLGGGATLDTLLGGKPKSGTITMGAGNGSADPNDDNGWFLDSNAFDNVEFQGAIVNAYAGDAQAGSPAFGKSDFYTVAAAEMTHCMGMSSSSPTAWTNLTTDTGVPDTAEGGGVGFFYVFNGPSIKHLMSSNNGGPNGSDRGKAVHAAGPGVPITFNGDTYLGAQDQGNASYESGRRYLVNNIFALMFKDAYNYLTVDPARDGTMYAILNETTGQLTVRGQTGSTNSNDTITVSFVNGDTIRVSVNIGNDVPGTGALPGAGSLPAFVSDFLAIGVTSIAIDAGDGNDAINIDSLPFFADATVMGGLGDDSIVFAGSSSNLDNVAAPIVFDGGSGADVAFFADDGSTNASAYTIARSGSSMTVSRPNFGGATLTSTATHTLNGAGGANTFNVNGTLSGTTWLLNGRNGIDVFNIGPVGGTADLVDGALTINGEDMAFDRIQYNDAGATAGIQYTIGGGVITRPGSANVSFGATTEIVNFFLGTGNDTFTFVPGDAYPQIGFGANPGNDTLLIDDRADTGADNYSLLGSQFQKSLAGGTSLPFCTFTGMESITFQANSGDNAISTSGDVSLPLSVFANGGNDNIAVNDGTVTVNTGSENPGVAPFGDTLGVNTDPDVENQSATAIVNQDDDVRALNVISNSATGTLRVTSGATLARSSGSGQAFTLTGVIDLAGGAFLARAGGVSQATLKTLLTRGYNNGGWNGTNAAGAINSSLAAGGIPDDAVGYGPGADLGITSIGSFNIAAADTLVRYTLYGDTDLNGEVNFDDYVRTDTGALHNRTGWSNGDFNYDNTVDFDDYVLLDLGYNA